MKRLTPPPSDGPAILRTYEEPPRADNGRLCCYDCRKPYGGLGWCDVIIPDAVWERIKPSPNHGGGLLCFNCIARRLAILEMEDVPMAVRSGPFAEQETTWPRPAAE